MRLSRKHATHTRLCRITANVGLKRIHAFMRGIGPHAKHLIG